MSPPIHTWEKEDFKLMLWDTHRVDSMGKAILRYQFEDRGNIIFEGEDFHCSPMYSIDGDEAAYSLLGFLSLQDGDTDREYFCDYTPDQIRWRDERAEELAWLVNLWEFEQNEALEF